MKFVKKKTKSKSKSKSTDEIFFTPMPTFIVHISNRPVQLVPCFVEVHHIYNFCTDANKVLLHLKLREGT